MKFVEIEFVWWRHVLEVVMEFAEVGFAWKMDLSKVHLDQVIHEDALKCQGHVEVLPA